MIEPSVGLNPVMPGWPGFVSALPNGYVSLDVAPTVEPLTVAEMAAHLRLSDDNAEPVPSAPAVALAGVGAGNCDNGAWRVGLTFVTADGETDLGDLSAPVTVIDKTTNGQIAVSAIPIGGSAVTGRNVYAIPPGGSVALFAIQIANNTATTVTLNLAASSLGVQAPSVNTTADPDLTFLIQMARFWAERDTERALLTQTWTLFLDSFPWWRAPIYVPFPPLQAVNWIKYYDDDGVLQTWDASNYYVAAPAGPTAQRAQIVPASGVSYPLLPSFALTQRRPDGVQVNFTAGWTSTTLVPPPIKSAMKLMGGNLYRNREAGQIIRGSADILPFGVDVLLAPFRVAVY